MPRRIDFKCSDCSWKGDRHANASRCIRCGGRLIRKEEAAERKQMLAAIEAAYDHLDIYGLVSHPDDALLESQKKVFDLLRPFVNRPKLGRL